MKIPPFFRLSPASAVLPSAKLVRYPYHDIEECPIGQAVKRSGEWHYYEPTQIADTRVRCTICIEMSHLPHA